MNGNSNMIVIEHTNSSIEQFLILDFSWVATEYVTKGELHRDGLWFTLRYTQIMN